MIDPRLSRRLALRAAATGTAASALPLFNVFAQGSAGVLRCGFWEHWVPAGNTAITELCREWGEKNRVEVKSIFAAHFPKVPTLANGDQVTSLEEDKIQAFYAGGRLYAEPKRLGPLV